MRHDDIDNELRERLHAAFGEVAELAHKINNPLTSLLGRAQLLRMSGSEDPKVLRAAEAIEDSAQRLADHVRELAAVVRGAREALAEAPRPETVPAGVE